MARRMSRRRLFEVLAGVPFVTAFPRPRLRAIKDKYDPAGLFFLHHGVGSEDWSADGFMRVN